MESKEIYVYDRPVAMIFSLQPDLFCVLKTTTDSGEKTAEPQYMQKPAKASKIKGLQVIRKCAFMTKNLEKMYIL